MSLYHDETTKLGFAWQNQSPLPRPSTKEISDLRALPE